MCSPGGHVFAWSKAKVERLERRSMMRQVVVAVLVGYSYHRAASPEVDLIVVWDR